ncbi:MAG: manganese transport protein [Pseudonocardiales bacterium]|jgi:manganese transport protein|nr:manganese transport protein [Pseudonocardiales bacterium]
MTTASTASTTDARPARARSRTLMYGPAFVAAIAYVDPGNFATNFTGGSRFGYLLLWVIVAANLMALLVQVLSAKLGLATGRDLAQMCRARYRRPVVYGLWLQAELVAIATDLAEVIGGAVALNLLFGLPLPVGGLVTGAVAFLLLGLQTLGYRRFEVVIAGLLGVIVLGFLVDVLLAGVDLPGVASGLVPGFAGTDSVLLATGILGATVMPHVIYLHSSLISGRLREQETDRRSLLRSLRLDVFAGLGIAGLVNAAMLVISAKLFHGPDTGVDSLETVHSGLSGQVGGVAATAFALALLASGFAASSVGTYAGQVVMSGFLRVRMSRTARRAITLVPALAVLLAGVDPTTALVWSQVVLSFGIPFALVPLVLITRDRTVMGSLVNRPITTVAASVVAALVIALNVFLLGGLILG